MASFGEEMKSNAFLHTASSSTALFGVVSCNVGLDKPGYLPFLVVPTISLDRITNSPHFSVLACIDHTSDIGNGHTGLRNVRGYCERTA
jgi:hypothetical protein